MAAPLTPLAASLPASVPFVGPEAQERARGAPFKARLGANESGFGPSPRVIDAIAKAARDVWMYGDPENHELRHALAEHHQVPANRIAIGEGIDSLLGHIVRLTVEQGTPVVTSAGAYPTFNYHVAGFGGELIAVPYRGDHEDPDALVEAAQRHRAPLLYFANPDNPMGSWHSAAQVEALIERLPSGTLLCLDEAYAEFAAPGSLPPLTLMHPQLIRLRTFSKAYGMAGARVGYAIGTAEMATAFNKVRNHFGMSRLSQAGALAALADEAYLAQTLEAARLAKAEIDRIASANGMTPLLSATNFVTLDAGRDGAFARQLVAALGEEGVFVRMPFVAPLDRCVRVTAGPPQELAAFAEALPRALARINAPTKAATA